MKTLTKLLAIACFACLFTGCEKIKIPHLDGVHSQNILGQWQLICVEKTVAGSSTEILKSTNYKSKNIIFDFFSNEKMSINKNGFLPKGEYYYYYESLSKPDYLTADLPGPNLVISNNKDFFDPNGNFAWYCYQVEGSNDMVLSRRLDKKDFIEWAYLIKNN